MRPTDPIAVRHTGAPMGSRNRLLQALCVARPQLAACGAPVDWPAGHELCAQGERFTDVYFPIEGVLSLTLTLRSGQGVDVGTVGCEGFVGLPVFLGVAASPSRVSQLVAGQVMRLPAKEFFAHVEGSRSASGILKRFAALSLQLGEQNAACHQHHSAHERACRWLATAVDRTRGKPLRLTQAAFAETLGVRRQTIGELALSLQRAGLVTYHRAVITVLSRSGIASRACECYSAMKTQYDDVVGPVLD